MKLDDKVRLDLEQHPLDRNPEVLAETFERMKKLEKMLGDAADELQGWWDDQGSYGTNSYDTWIPEIRKLIQGDS